MRVDDGDRPPHSAQREAWSSGEMALRWTAAGMLEAEKQFRKIIGYRDLATLIVAIERDHDRRRHTDTAHIPSKEAAIVLTA